MYEVLDNTTECNYVDHIDSSGMGSMLVEKGTLMWGCQACSTSFCDEYVIVSLFL